MIKPFFNFSGKEQTLWTVPLGAQNQSILYPPPHSEYWSIKFGTQLFQSLSCFPQFLFHILSTQHPPPPQPPNPLSPSTPSFWNLEPKGCRNPAFSIVYPSVLNFSSTFSPPPSSQPPPLSLSTYLTCLQICNVTHVQEECDWQSSAGWQKQKIAVMPWLLFEIIIFLLVEQVWYASSLSTLSPALIISVGERTFILKRETPAALVWNEIVFGWL